MVYIDVNLPVGAFHAVCQYHLTGQKLGFMPGAKRFHLLNQVAGTLFGKEL